MFKKIILALLFLPCLGQAQNQHHEIGLFAGASSYYGDLQQNLFPESNYRAVGGLMYKYFLHPNFGVRAGINYTSLYGSDSMSKIPAIRQRNLNFETNLIEFSTGFEANLLPVDPDLHKFSPYVFAQAAVFYYNPYIIANQSDLEKIYLRPLGTEGQGLKNYPERTPYSLVNLAFPVGGGIKFLIGNKVFVNFEMGFRFTTTDYLDDVSKTYVNFDYLNANGQRTIEYAFRTDELTDVWDGNYPNEGFQRGDDKKFDMYWFGGVSVSVYFDSFGNPYRHKQSRCPRRINNY